MAEKGKIKNVKKSPMVTVEEMKVYYASKFPHKLTMQKVNRYADKLGFVRHNKRIDGVMHHYYIRKELKNYPLCYTR